MFKVIQICFVAVKNIFVLSDLAFVLYNCSMKASFLVLDRQFCCRIKMSSFSSFENYVWYLIEFL